MPCRPTLATCAVILSALLAFPALATTAPASKRPVARRAPAASVAKPAPAGCGTPAPALASLAAPPQTRPAAAIAAVTTPAASGSRAGTPAAPATTATPQVVQLRGVVWLPSGLPCAGASVYPAGAPRQLVVTDAKGNFTLPVLAGSPASLRIEYFGVGSSRVEVPTPSGDVLHVTLGQ